MNTPYPGQNPPPPYGYPAPPQPPKKNNAGKIIGIGCGSLVGLSLLLAACGALVASSDGFKEGLKEGVKAASAAPTPPAPAPSGSAAAPAAKPAPEPAQKGLVELSASPTEFKPTILSQGAGDYTSLLVTVANNGVKEVNVNVLSFEVTAEDGARRNAELAVDEDQIDTVTLAKGEKVTGTITVKGKITAKTVYFQNGLLGNRYHAQVK